MMRDLSEIMIFCLGLLVFYMAIFMYEDEEGRWQNRIEVFWDTIDGRAREVNSKTIALFGKISEIVSIFFDIVFGSQLMSVRAIGASTSFSTASLLIFTTLVGVGHQISKQTFLTMNIFSFALLILPFALASQKCKFIRIIALIYQFIFVVAMLVNIFSNKQFSLEKISIFSGYLFSLLTDIIFIILARDAIRRLAVTRSNIKIVFLILLQATYAAVIFALPLWTGLNAYRHHKQFPLVYLFREVLITTAAFNLFTALICAALFLVILVIFLNKLFWPILARAIYPLARFEIVRNKKFLVALGVACMCITLPSAWAEFATHLVPS